MKKILLGTAALIVVAGIAVTTPDKTVKLSSDNSNIPTTSKQSSSVQMAAPQKSDIVNGQATDPQSSPTKTNQTSVPAQTGDSQDVVMPPTITVTGALKDNEDAGSDGNGGVTVNEYCDLTYSDGTTGQKLMAQGDRNGSFNVLPSYSCDQFLGQVKA